MPETKDKEPEVTPETKQKKASVKEAKEDKVRSQNVGKLTIKVLPDLLKALLERPYNELTIDEKMIVRRYQLESRLSRRNDTWTPGVYPKRTLHNAQLELDMIKKNPAGWKKMVQANGRFVPPRRRNRVYDDIVG